MGWGTEVALRGEAASWFHIPIPTPPEGSDDVVWLERVFLLFETGDDMDIRKLHVYDGASMIAEFVPPFLHGNHLSTVSTANTFTLPARRRVRRGIGLSFNVLAPVFTGGAGAPPVNRLVVAAAGSECDVTSALLANVRDFATTMFRLARFGATVPKDP